MRTRLYVAGVLGGLALLAITVVVVFAFGRHNPSPPSLRDNPRPEIPGEILYLDQDNCFRRAAASGETEESLVCLPQHQFFGRMYWLEQDKVGMVQFEAGGPMLYEVNLRTGEISSTGRSVNLEAEKRISPSGYYGGAFAADGTFASFEERGELVLLKDGQRTQIADFDVARFRQPRVASWSPDSAWILVQYYPLRGDMELWIVSRDGSVRGTLTKDARPGAEAEVASWRIGDKFSPPLP